MVVPMNNENFSVSDEPLANVQKWNVPVPDDQCYIKAKYLKGRYYISTRDAEDLLAGDELLRWTTFGKRLRRLLNRELFPAETQAHEASRPPSRRYSVSSTRPPSSRRYDRQVEMWEERIRYERSECQPW